VKQTHIQYIHHIIIIGPFRLNSEQWQRFLPYIPTTCWSKLPSYYRILPDFGSSSVIFSVVVFAVASIKKTPWAESASELYRPSDRRLSAKLVPTFADRGCHVVSVTNPYGRILGFLDRRRYFFFQVPDPLLWKSGSSHSVCNYNFSLLSVSSL
jgi:hypothetical protein